MFHNSIADLTVIPRPKIMIMKQTNKIALTVASAKDIKNQNIILKLRTSSIKVISPYINTFKNSFICSISSSISYKRELSLRWENTISCTLLPTPT